MLVKKILIKTIQKHLHHKQTLRTKSQSKNKRSQLLLIHLIYQNKLKITKKGVKVIKEVIDLNHITPKIKKESNQSNKN